MKNTQFKLLLLLTTLASSWGHSDSRYLSPVPAPEGVYYGQYPYKILDKPGSWKQRCSVEISDVRSIGKIDGVEHYQAKVIYRIGKRIKYSGIMDTITRDNWQSNKNYHSTEELGRTKHTLSLDIKTNRPMSFTTFVDTRTQLSDSLNSLGRFARGGVNLGYGSGKYKRCKLTQE